MINTSLLNRFFVKAGLLPVLLFAACTNQMEDINALTGAAAPTEDKATDVVFIYSEGGHTRGRMYAKEFIRHEQAKPPYSDMRKQLKVDFYNDSLMVVSTLTAKYARYYEQKGNALFRDSIVIFNSKGEKLETEELVWNQSLHRIYTEKPVKITTATQQFYGDGLEATEDFNWYRIKKLHGIMQVEKNKMPE